MAEVQNSRRLVELTGFGSNPGALRSWLYLPTIFAPGASLVVVLHGCTQNAATYDHGAGWTQLAEEKGFAVLFPEQQRANNANLCFNWFEPGDSSRNSGEALSIREMIGHVVQSHGMDSGSVHITGLSAGGAMANVMLATYPEVFAGGAIIGGLPFGVAAGVGQAFERMQGRNPPTERTLQSALAAASPNSGDWPRISIWHGTHDQTVKPVNAAQTATQWIGAHGASEALHVVEDLKGHTRKAWRDESGREVVELYLISGMAHGVPLSATAAAPLGNTGPFMLEAGISSTVRIARGWGLATDEDVARVEGPSGHAARPAADPHGIERIVAKAMEYAAPKRRAKRAEAGIDTSQGVAKVINDALRAAGLMR